METSVHLPRTSVQTPTGLSFDIPDLLMVQAWSDYHNLRMGIELDTATGSEEFEELLSLSYGTSKHPRWTIWRSTEGIVVQPTKGRPLRFDRMSVALEELIPARD
jgi:hypothetical protein